MDDKYRRSYDLEERTAVFGENIISLCKFASKNPITMPIINQLIRSGTSIGANYREANGASSKKESKETGYWLRLLAKADSSVADNCRDLWKSAQEFLLLFSKIATSVKYR